MFEFNEKNWPGWSMYFTHDASSPQHLTDHREQGNFYCLLSIGGSDVCVCDSLWAPFFSKTTVCLNVCYERDRQWNYATLFQHRHGLRFWTWLYLWLTLTSSAGSIHLSSLWSKEVLALKMCLWNLRWSTRRLSNDGLRQLLLYRVYLLMLIIILSSHFVSFCFSIPPPCPHFHFQGNKHKVNCVVSLFLFVNSHITTAWEHLITCWWYGHGTALRSEGFRLYTILIQWN